MGSSLSSPSAIARFAARDPISLDDELWGQLDFSASRERVDEPTAAVCANLVRNNVESENFQALVLRVLEALEEAKHSVSGAQLHQACACVFLMRTFLKHMIETLEPEDLEPHLTSSRTAGSSAAATPQPQDLCEPLIKGLLTVLADAELSDASYWLHMECMSAVIVCMSTQMFCSLSAAAPQPLLVAVLNSPNDLVGRVITRLLHHYTSPATPPPRNEGLLHAVVDYAQYMLLLPWHLLSHLFRDSETQVAGNPQNWLVGHYTLRAVTRFCDLWRPFGSHMALQNERCCCYSSSHRICLVLR